MCYEWPGAPNGWTGWAAGLLKPATWTALAHINEWLSLLDRMPPKLPGGHVGQPTATHFGWLPALRSPPPTLHTKTRARAAPVRIHSFSSRGGGGRRREQAAPFPTISHGAVRRPPRVSGGRRHRGAVLLLLHVRPWYCTRSSAFHSSLVAMKLTALIYLNSGRRYSWIMRAFCVC